jgi:hypothetical protein
MTPRYRMSRVTRKWPAFLAEVIVDVPGLAASKDAPVTPT